MEEKKRPGPPEAPVAEVPDVPVLVADEPVPEGASEPEVPDEMWDQAVAAHLDAANASMRRHGGEEWSFDDWQAGLRAFVEAAPVQLNKRQIRTFSESARQKWAALHDVAMPRRRLPAPPA